MYIHPWSISETQGLKPLDIIDGKHERPAPNHNHLRLYGHLLCPFVEKVRLVLAAKKLEYQSVQINLQKRARWHYILNGGFVPILETP
jgi:glutathione S-transferase